MSVQAPSAAAAARHAEAVRARNGMRASEHALAKVLARIHAEKDHHEYGYANTDGEILASVMQRVMHDVPSDSAPTAERFRIVVQHCPDCARTEGLECELTETAVDEAGCDAEVVELREGPARGHLTHTIPPAVRRTVLHRDGCRCRVPGCNNRLFLDLHHLRHRPYGGRHVLANLLTVCSVHHRLIHDGKLAAEPVPGGVRFTFPSGRTVTSRLELATAWA